MSNKLDERYVEYDLDNAISILPIKNGGTGSNVITPGMVMISFATGGAVPFETVVKASDITVANLNALQNYAAGDTIETRIGNIENNHVGGVGSKIHVPISGTSNQYLKSVNAGNPVWQSGLLPTTGGGADLVWGSAGAWVAGGGGTEYVDPDVIFNSVTVTLTNSTTWVIPAGVKLLKIWACGGGGGGGCIADHGNGGNGNNGGITYISGILTAPGGKGGKGADIGTGGGAGGAAGSSATLSSALAEFIQHGTARAGIARADGRGGYNDPLGTGYTAKGSHAAASNYGGGGGAGIWGGDSAGGGGSSKPIQFFLDVATLSSLIITIGPGGSGGTGGPVSPQPGKNGAKGVIKITYA